MHPLLQSPKQKYLIDSYYEETKLVSWSESSQKQVHNLKRKTSKICNLSEAVTNLIQQLVRQPYEMSYVMNELLEKIKPTLKDHFALIESLFISLETCNHDMQSFENLA